MELGKANRFPLSLPRDTMRNTPSIRSSHAHMHVMAELVHWLNKPKVKINSLVSVYSFDPTFSLHDRVAPKYLIDA